MTIPLLLNSRGEKIGKSTSSRGETVWLSPHLTPPFDFYQFFKRIDDEDVGKFLRSLTLLELEEIQKIEQTHQEAPHKREAQTILADQVTQFVHGKEEWEKCLKITHSLYESKNDVRSLSEEDFENIPHFDVEESLVFQPVVDLLYMTKLVPSKG